MEAFLFLTIAQPSELAYYSDMKYFLSLALILACSVQADIYRSVDKQGNVTYSDVPDTQAEQIELEALPTYEALPIPVVPADDAQSQVNDNDENLKKPKYKISIVSPEQNQSIWEGGGIFTATATITPELNTDRVDQVQFKLDGKALGEPQTGLAYTLKNIERGSHILTVSVVDKQGKVLKTSKSVLFHMHRHSVAKKQQIPVNPPSN